MINKDSRHCHCKVTVKSDLSKNPYIMAASEVADSVLYVCMRFDLLARKLMQFANSEIQITGGGVAWSSLMALAQVATH